MPCNSYSYSGSTRYSMSLKTASKDFFLVGVCFGSSANAGSNTTLRGRSLRFQNDTTSQIKLAAITMLVNFTLVVKTHDRGACFGEEQPALCQYADKMKRDRSRE